MSLEIGGLATGIGSLPYQDPGRALELIFKYVAGIPFWPQLPRRDVREGMLMQFSEGLPCLRATSQGLVFDPREREKELEVFYGRIIEENTGSFGISFDFAPGFYRFISRLETSDLSAVRFLKCHVTGPFTFAAGLKDEQGAALLHDDVMMQAISKGLAMKALWQVRQLKHFAKKTIIFIDEPYLGCFGSAYTPVNRETVVGILDEFTRAVRSADVLVGVHCCGNTDWSIFTDVAGIDIINFDAFNFLERVVIYAENLKFFLERGGILCWGIVPTEDAPLKENAVALSSRIRRGIELMSAKGIPAAVLSEQLLVSPSCGLGALAEGRAEPIFKALSEVSGLLRKGRF